MNWVIQADNLLIRPFKEKDIEKFMSYRNNLEWMKFQSFKGLSYEDYKTFLLSEIDIHRGLQLAIIDERSDQLIGDLFVVDMNGYYIGYTIHPDFSRKGLMKQSVSALINYLKENDSKKDIKAETDLENVASQSLLKSLGFRKVESDGETLTFLL